MKKNNPLAFYIPLLFVLLTTHNTIKSQSLENYLTQQEPTEIVLLESATCGSDTFQNNLLSTNTKLLNLFTGYEFFR